MKHAILHIRLQEDHLVEIKRAAIAEGITLTAWATMHLLRAARASGVPGASELPYESQGKTTIGLDALRRHVQNGGTVSFADAEHAPSAEALVAQGLKRTKPTPPSELTPEERRASIAPVPALPLDRTAAEEIAADHAAAELVFSVLGHGCLLCGDRLGRVVPADRELFDQGHTGPSNLQVLCDDCAEGAGDLRDEGHREAIRKAVRQSNKS